jgi:hypothetical protein
MFLKDEEECVGDVTATPVGRWTLEDNLKQSAINAGAQRIVERDNCSISERRRPALDVYEDVSVLMRAIDKENMYRAWFKPTACLEGRTANRLHNGRDSRQLDVLQEVPECIYGTICLDMLPTSGVRIDRIDSSFSPGGYP